MFPVSLSVLIRRTTLAVSVSMNSMITATIRSLSARIVRIAAATSAMKPSSGQNASGVMLPDFLFADNVRRLGQMNHRFRKTALFAVFFLLRGGGHPIGCAGGSNRKAATPQIKSSSSMLELLKSTSFDLQSTTSIDDPTTSNNFPQLSRSMVEVLPTFFTRIANCDNYHSTNKDHQRSKATTGLFHFEIFFTYLDNLL